MNQFNIIAKRRFLPIFTAQFLGAFNDNVFKNSLIFLVTYRLADKIIFNSSTLVALAAGAFILPFFLFSAIAGELADKFHKSRLIRWVKGAEIPIMMLGIWGIYQESICLMLVALFFAGVQAAFFGPLKYSILPQQLQKNELVTGNGLIEAGTFIAILFGTITGGSAILAWHGKEIITFILLAVALAGFLSSLFILPAPATSPDLELDYNILRSTAAQIKYSRGNRTVFTSIIGISWFWLIGATFLANMPGYTRDILHASGGVVTLLFSLFSIGTAIGSVICSRILNGEITAKYTPAAAIGISIFILDMFFATRNSPGNIGNSGDYITLIDFLKDIHSWRLIMDFLMVSVMGGIYIVPLYAMLQAKGEESHRSRIIASNNILNSLFMVISSVITMVVLGIGLKIDDIFLLLAVVNIFMALYLCQLLPERLLKKVLRGILKILYRVEVKGLENYRAAGEKVVVVANHVSFLDPPLLAIFLPGSVTFAINSFIAQKWWIRPSLSLVKTFSVDPGNPLATKMLIDEIKHRKAKIAIFPEGRITVTGSLMKVYEGPGMIADRSGAKILPVRIDGPQYSPFSRIKKKVRVRWFPKVTITILPPQEFKVPKEIKGRARRKLIGQKLGDIMVDMMFISSDINKTLFQSLIEAEKINGPGHRILMDLDRKEITYCQLLARSFILGEKIAGETMKGEFVGIMLPGSAACITLFFAMQAYGRVPAMINFATGINNMLHAVKIARIKKIYTSRRFIELGKLHKDMEKLAQAVSIVYLEDIRPSISFISKISGLIKARFPEKYYSSHAAGITPESPAAILFTSGSEGVPKGVALSHKNIQANRYQGEAMIDFGPGDVVFNALPLFHSFGLTVGALLPVLCGIKTFLYPSPLHYRIIPELIYDINATLMFGTDTFLAGYARFAHPYDFRSIRYIFAGAEKLKPETRKLWSEKFGARILEGYGATETAPVISINTAIHNKAGTVGRFLPGISYKLTPVEGIGEGGRLSVAGPNVMLGYLSAKNPGEIIPPVADNQEGWYDTGDIVSIDAQGFITILGRAKRFAKIAGEMVSLTFVEEFIGCGFLKNQHAIISVPDAKKGEQLILVTDSRDLTREQLVKLARQEGVSELFVPKKVMNVSEVPLLATGKIDYPAVAKIVEGAGEV